MNSKSKPFTKSSESEDSDEKSYQALLRARKNQSANIKSSDHISQKKPETNYSNILSQKNSEPNDENSYQEILRARKNQSSENNNFMSTKNNSVADITEVNNVSATEYLEKMKRNRELININTVTTVTFDVRYNSNTITVEEKKLTNNNSINKYESDSETEENNLTTEDVILSIVYNYNNNELLKTTTPISKENMINFLSTQGANGGGFDPVEAYNNTVSDEIKYLLKEETIRKNIVGKDDSLIKKTKNEELIEELKKKKNHQH